MNQSDTRRNAFMLKGALAKNGYDWWWHHFTGYSRSTGLPRTFFIEYFVCNPALGGHEPILGQLEHNQQRRIKPSYAMVKVGYWGKDAQQIHNFYGIKDFSCAADELNLRIGECTLTETSLQGACALSEESSRAHPEFMSGWGSMRWNLAISKKIAFNVGFGAAPFFRRINAFEMYWHAEGIRTEFSGEVILNDEVYDVYAERSYGYADKNWGSNFTSPWLWISSCHLQSLTSGKILSNSAIEIGGGNPKIFGISLGRKILGGLYYEGKSYEYNFTKFWTRSDIQFNFEEKSDINRWTVSATNSHSRMELVLECKKDEMLFVNYESPDGRKLHNRLWNGGTGYGEIRLFDIQRGPSRLVDVIAIRNAGCEYGEYAASK